MGRRIDHALVMDTDHLPGGGGYAVAGFSDGTSEAERLFASQNFGISDYLHDPQNARVYFSFFRVPNGRFAFVRRFAHGRRRSGVQNRLFVHTLFLDETTLEQLHFLPWLLADATFRIGRGSPMPLSLDVEPLLADPAFPPLEWQNAISAGDAFEQLKLRAGQVERKLSESVIGATLESLARRSQVALPQGPPYEQLSLVAWSMLPPLDRLAMPWTQHDAGNLAGVAFRVANAPAVSAPAQHASAYQRIVTVNTHSVDDWSEYQSRTREYRLTITSEKLLHWLEFRDANAELIADPNASEAVIVARLQKLAAAVRKEHREPWVNDQEILRFLWSLKNAERFVATTGIGAVVFREPPPRSWLVESEAKAEAVTRFFLAGPASPKTREAIASWLVERRPNVSAETLASLAMHLTESPLFTRLMTWAVDAAPAARKTALFDAFWRHLDVKDVPSLAPAMVKTIADASDDVIARWTAVARGLPAHPRCEELLDQLPGAGVEREWRDLLLQRGSAETIMRLDFAGSPDLRKAITHLLKSHAASDRAAELVLLAAHPHTLPRTRRLIETDLLPHELGRLRGEEEWERFLSASRNAAVPSLFAWRNLAAVVAAARPGVVQASGLRLGGMAGRRPAPHRRER